MKTFSRIIRVRSFVLNESSLTLVSSSRQLFHFIQDKNSLYTSTMLGLRAVRLTKKYLPSLARRLHQGIIARHGYLPSEVDPSTAVRINFVDRDANERAVVAPPDKSILEVAHSNDIDLEGACEGSLACSTCHVYLDQKTFDALDEPCDDENDMLDLAFGLTELCVFHDSCFLYYPHTIQITRI